MSLNTGSLFIKENYAGDTIRDSRTVGVQGFVNVVLLMKML